MYTADEEDQGLDILEQSSPAELNSRLVTRHILLTVVKGLFINKSILIFKTNFLRRHQ